MGFFVVVCLLFYGLVFSLPTFICRKSYCVFFFFFFCHDFEVAIALQYKEQIMFLP